MGTTSDSTEVVRTIQQYCRYSRYWYGDVQVKFASIPTTKQLLPQSGIPAGSPADFGFAYLKELGTGEFPMDGNVIALISA